MLKLQEMKCVHQPFYSCDFDTSHSHDVHNPLLFRLKTNTSLNTLFKPVVGLMFQVKMSKPNHHVYDKKKKKTGTFFNGLINPMKVC